MNAVKSALLLSLPALLAGCGGGSDGGGGGSAPAPAKYTFDFVAFKESTLTGSERNCAVYGTSNAGSYIAQNAQGNDITLHVHSSDGTWKESYRPSNGKIAINQSSINTSDYISIVSTSRGGIYDILTIEKRFIPTALTLNTFDSWDNRVACKTETNATVSSYNGYIDDQGDGTGFFIFRSTIDETESNSPNGINYDSESNTEVLATRLCKSSLSCDDRDLVQYNFVSAQDSEDASSPVQLQNVDSFSVPWIALSTTDTVLNAANIYIDRNQPIKWQTLPLVDGTYSYASDLHNEYYVSIEASHKSWSTSYSKSVADPGSTIDEFTTLTDLSMPAPDVSLSLEPNCSSSATNFCFKGYNSMPSAELNFQRSAVYAESIRNKVHQTIYASPKLNQPLMSFDDSNIDDVWAAAAITKKETQLINTNNSDDVTSTFMHAYLNVEALENNNYQTTSGLDTLSAVQSLNVSDNDQKALLTTNHMLFESLTL